jgi:hypothetical protein
MSSKYCILLFLLCNTLISNAQTVALKGVPHKFKEIRTGATLEAVKEHGVVKLYILVDDIGQYDEIMVERSDEQQQNYSQCKDIKIEKGKYPNNYVETEDKYPVSSKMTNVYRLKAITADGIMKMFPAVAISIAEVSAPNK